MQVRDIVNASLIWQCGWRRVRHPRKTLLAAWAPPAPERRSPLSGNACRGRSELSPSCCRPQSLLPPRSAVSTTDSNEMAARTLGGTGPGGRQVRMYMYMCSIIVFSSEHDMHIYCLACMHVIHCILHTELYMPCQ